MNTFGQVALAAMDLTGLRGDDLTASTIPVQMPRNGSRRALNVVEATPLLYALNHPRKRYD